MPNPKVFRRVSLFRREIPGRSIWDPFGPPFRYLSGTKTSFFAHSTVWPRFCDIFNSVLIVFERFLKTAQKPLTPFCSLRSAHSEHAKAALRPVF